MIEDWLLICCLSLPSMKGWQKESMKDIEWILLPPAPKNVWKLERRKVWKAVVALWFLLPSAPKYERLERRKVWKSVVAWWCLLPPAPQYERLESMKVWKAEVAWWCLLPPAPALLWAWLLSQSGCPPPPLLNLPSQSCQTSPPEMRKERWWDSRLRFRDGMGGELETR